MSLLRFYLAVGGTSFDAQQFSIAASKMGIETGRVTYIKRREITWPCPDGTSKTIKIDSGVTGTDGDGMFLWKTKYVEYAADARAYYRQLTLPLDEYARLWLHEDNAILEFLERFRELIPRVRDYATGEYFVLLKAIYDISHGCPFYSERVIKLLSELGACLETDNESPKIHFYRLKNVGHESPMPQF